MRLESRARFYWHFAFSSRHSHEKTSPLRNRQEHVFVVGAPVRPPLPPSSKAFRNAISSAYPLSFRAFRNATPSAHPCHSGHSAMPFPASTLVISSLPPCHFERSEKSKIVAHNPSLPCHSDLAPSLRSRQQGKVPAEISAIACIATNTYLYHSEPSIPAIPNGPPLPSKAFRNAIPSNLSCHSERSEESKIVAHNPSSPCHNDLRPFPRRMLTGIALVCRPFAG